MNVVKRTEKRPSQMSAGRPRTPTSHPAAPRAPTPSFRGPRESDLDELPMVSSPRSTASSTRNTQVDEGMGNEITPYYKVVNEIRSYHKVVNEIN